MSSLKLSLPLDEVKGLLSKETCIKKKEGKLKLRLHPMYMNDFRKGVKEELDALSSCYSKELSGILMGSEKIAMSSTGAIRNIDPFIHLFVQGTFYVFSPEVNASLEGIVKKKSPNHLSCLVHKMFNVSVPRPQEVASHEWVGSSVQEGDVIKVAITNIDMSFYLPMITGRLESIVSRRATISMESKGKKIFADSGIDSSGEERDEDATMSEVKNSKVTDEIDKKQFFDGKEQSFSEKKKKRKKKDNNQSFGDDVGIEGIPSTSAWPVGDEGVNVMDSKEKIKKKKHKRASISEAESDALFLNSLMTSEDCSLQEPKEDISDDSPSISKKKKKKSFGDKSDASFLSSLMAIEGSTTNIFKKEKAEDSLSMSSKKKKKQVGEAEKDAMFLSALMTAQDNPMHGSNKKSKDSPGMSKKKNKKMQAVEDEKDASFLNSLMVSRDSSILGSKKQESKDSPGITKKKKKKRVSQAETDASFLDMLAASEDESNHSSKKKKKHSVGTISDESFLNSLMATEDSSAQKSKKKKKKHSVGTISDESFLNSLMATEDSSVHKSKKRKAEDSPGMSKKKKKKQDLDISW